MFSPKFFCFFVYAATAAGLRSCASQDVRGLYVVGPQGYVSVSVYKNGEVYFILMGRNVSNETVSGDSEYFILDSIAPFSPNFWSNSYCCKGIRSDGNEHQFKKG